MVLVEDKSEHSLFWYHSLSGHKVKQTLKQFQRWLFRGFALMTGRVSSIKPTFWAWTVRFLHFKLSKPLEFWIQKFSMHVFTVHLYESMSLFLSYRLPPHTTLTYHLSIHWLVQCLPILDMLTLHIYQCTIFFQKTSHKVLEMRKVILHEKKKNFRSSY